MIVNDTKDILKEYELFAKKKFGQNFITSSVILEHIIKVANITKDDYVLEISSPGVDRILKKEKDFERFEGFKIKVTTIQAINNQK